MKNNFQQKDQPTTQKLCGFVGLIGRPNVGKSTLMNEMVGQKLSITAYKAQTTRNKILGIRTDDESQAVFIDTPGIHRAVKLLNKKMVEYAVDTLRETDINLWLVEPLSHKALTKDGVEKLYEEDRDILKLLSGKEKDTLVVINKMDTIPQEEALLSIEAMSQLGDFAEIIPVSALKAVNVDHLISTLKKYLPKHPFYFESGQVTDVSERFIASEFVREELFMRLQQEIPYSVAVQVEQFEESPDCIRIACVICVERESQKGIIIGKKGEMLKKVGISARKKIEGLMGTKVFLALHVKVIKQWSRNAKHLQSLGYE